MRAFLSRARAPIALLFRWTSVWLPAVLCVQLAVRGLWPAERERVWLEQEEARMEQRVQAELDRRTALEGDHAKLADPIWRERVRRSLRVAGSEPLTLERSYVGTLVPR